MTNCVLTSKTKALLLKPRETTKMMKNCRCHTGKGMVDQRHRFLFPDSPLSTAEPLGKPSQRPPKASLLIQRAWRGILMPRGETCRETIFAAQLPRNYPHRGGNFERRKKSPLLRGRGNLRGILRGNLVVRVIASQKAARQWGGAILAARHQDVSQGPLGRPPPRHLTLLRGTLPRRASRRVMPLGWWPSQGTPTY